MPEMQTNSSASRRQWIRAALGACLSSLLVAASFAAAAGSGRAAAPQQSAAPPLLRVVAKDAPVRAALEMVLTAGRADFSLDNGVQGLVSVDTKTPVALDDVLRAVLDGGAMHLELSLADGVYLVRPQEGSPRPNLPASRPPGAAGEAAAARSVLDVPRRLSGVVIDGSGRPTHCILETGSVGPAQIVEVLTVNRAGVKLASGFPGEAALTVERLEADKLILRDSKNRRIVAPLRGLNDR
ncbi:MAG TPA: hypothetical protein VM490_17895 [Armatimonadaceae bacterium]|jgi:hypothetical protein|nr:hypothetical protein [Armatimonadaceae bacterium]